MLIVFTSVPNVAEAESLAEALVRARLAACVQIMPPMTSVYEWEAKLQKEQEHLLIIKTLEGKYAALEAFIRSNHSYAVPEITAIKAERTSGSYLVWMREILVRD